MGLVGPRSLKLDKEKKQFKSYNGTLFMKMDRVFCIFLR